MPNLENINAALGFTLNETLNQLVAARARIAELERPVPEPPAAPAANDPGAPAGPA